MPISVGIIEDQPLMQPGLALSLQPPEFAVEFVLARPSEFIDAIDHNPVSVVVADLPPEPAQREEVFAYMARSRGHPGLPRPAFVVLSHDPSIDAARQALDCGALAFLISTETRESELQSAVRAAARGGGKILLDLIAQHGGLRQAPPLRRPTALEGLTAREREVAQALSGGADNLKIAALLGISERTVKAHVSSMYRKLKVENRVELALACLRAEVTPPDEHRLGSARVDCSPHGHGARDPARARASQSKGTACGPRST